MLNWGHHASHRMHGVYDDGCGGSDNGGLSNCQCLGVLVTN